MLLRERIAPAATTATAARSTGRDLAHGSLSDGDDDDEEEEGEEEEGGEESGEENGGAGGMGILVASCTVHVFIPRPAGAGLGGGSGGAVTKAGLRQAGLSRPLPHPRVAAHLNGAPLYLPPQRPQLHFVGNHAATAQVGEQVRPRSRRIVCCLLPCWSWLWLQLVAWTGFACVA